MIINLQNLKRKKILYDINGYVVLKNFFSKIKMKNLKENLFNYLSEKKNSFKKREIHLTKNLGIINSVHNLKWPYLKKLQKNKKLLKIVDYFIGEKTKQFGAEVFAKPAKVGMPAPIHQDNYFWNLNNAKGLTVWIALDKSTKKNGSIFYFKKSQKDGLVAHKASYAPGTSQEIKNKKILAKYQKVFPKLNQGDLLIHHCLVIHGSKKNNSKKNRAGLTLRFIGKSSKINQFAKAKYENNLKKQLKRI